MALKENTNEITNPLTRTGRSSRWEILGIGTRTRAQSHGSLMHTTNPLHGASDGHLQALPEEIDEGYLP